MTQVKYKVANLAILKAEMQRGVKKCVYAKIYLIEHIVPKLFDLCIYLRTLQKLVLMKDFPQKS